MPVGRPVPTMRTFHSGNEFFQTTDVDVGTTINGNSALPKLTLSLMRFLSAVTFLLLGAEITAFSVLPSTRRCPSRSVASFSEPSDTSSDYYDDVVVDIEGETYAPTTPEETVFTNVMDLMPDALAQVSNEKRAAINEALYKLERLNPTKDPTLSPLLNGIWELRYVGGYSEEFALSSPTRQLALFLYSGGYSPGIFALQLAQKLPFVEVGDLDIAISRSQPRVEASIPVKVLGGSESKVVVRARLETMSDIRLQETYEIASVLGNPVELPKPLQYTRDLFVTYLDDDLLIVRDSTGVPEVLLRKDKTFRTTVETEPGDVEDLTAPGTSS